MTRTEKMLYTSKTKPRVAGMARPAALMAG